MTDKTKQTHSPAEMNNQLATNIAEDIRMKRLEMLLGQIKDLLPKMQEVTEVSSSMIEEAQKQITDFAMQMKVSKVDQDGLKGFFKHPYAIVPTERRRQNEWYLIIPKFLPIQIGWLHHTDEGHNYFLINRYVDWLNELPKALKDELGFKDPLDVSLEGLYITGSKKDLEKAREKYGKHIVRAENGKLLIREKTKFELLSEMVRDGILPFTPEPIPAEYLVERKCDFTLRPFQMRDYKEFLQWGNRGIFYPPGVGKTYLGIWALTHLKPPHIVTVPSITLIEQWRERLELYTDLKLDEEVIVTTYQSALKKYGSREFNLMIVDEVHHLPANEFGKLNFMKKKFFLGLSATPQREDGREELVFALCWDAGGLNWEELKKLGMITNPPCHVWIVSNATEKLNKLNVLLQEKSKTVIFCDGIELGKMIATKCKIPHVYGKQKKGRLEIIKNADVCVVSRVGDEGLSLPDIERVIEVDWLYGSRRQEMQRFGRLLHSEKEGEHHIIFTVEEYAHDHKRLFSVMDKGFKIVIHREGMSEKVIMRAIESSSPRQRTGRQPTNMPSKVHTDRDMDMPTGMPTSGILALPGIQKNMKLLDETQRKVWGLLLQNDGRWYTTREMCMLLGYANASHFGLSPMLAKKLIEKKGNQYRTNFSNIANLQG